VNLWNKRHRRRGRSRRCTCRVLCRGSARSDPPVRAVVKVVDEPGARLEYSASSPATASDPRHPLCSTCAVHRLQHGRTTLPRKQGMGIGRHHSMTGTCPSRPSPIADFVACCCAARRAAKLNPATLFYCSFAPARKRPREAFFRRPRGWGSVTCAAGHRKKPRAKRMDPRCGLHPGPNVILRITDGQIFWENRSVLQGAFVRGEVGLVGFPLWFFCSGRRGVFVAQGSRDQKKRSRAGLSRGEGSRNY